MSRHPRVIKDLGEIALKVNDLAAMTDFYHRVVGLPILSSGERVSFLTIGEGFAGHTCVLALFVRDGDTPEARRSTLDHLAFTIDLHDYDAELERLAELGIETETTTHAWVRWRSIYFTDPEGNTVELVCYDGTIVD